MLLVELAVHGIRRPEDRLEDQPEDPLLFVAEEEPQRVDTRAEAAIDRAQRLGQVGAPEGLLDPRHELRVLGLAGKPDRAARQVVVAEVEDAERDRLRFAGDLGPHAGAPEGEPRPAARETGARRRAPRRSSRSVAVSA